MTKRLLGSLYDSDSNSNEVLKRYARKDLISRLKALLSVGAHRGIPAIRKKIPEAAFEIKNEKKQIHLRENLRVAKTAPRLPVIEENPNYPPVKKISCKVSTQTVSSPEDLAQRTDQRKDTDVDTAAGLRIIGTKKNLSLKSENHLFRKLKCSEEVEKLPSLDLPYKKKSLAIVSETDPVRFCAEEHKDKLFGSPGFHMSAHVEDARQTPEDRVTREKNIHSGLIVITQCLQEQDMVRGELLGCLQGLKGSHKMHHQVRSADGKIGKSTNVDRLPRRTQNQSLSLGMAAPISRPRLVSTSLMPRNICSLDIAPVSNGNNPNNSQKHFRALQGKMRKKVIYGCKRPSLSQRNPKLQKNEIELVFISKPLKHSHHEISPTVGKKFPKTDGHTQLPDDFLVSHVADTGLGGVYRVGLFQPGPTSNTTYKVTKETPLQRKGPEDAQPFEPSDRLSETSAHLTTPFIHNKLFEFPL